MRGSEIAQATDQHKWIEEIWIGENGETVVGHWPLVFGQASKRWVEPTTKDRRPTTVSYRLARSRLMMSSEVMTPVSFLLSSTTGKVERLYLSNSSATSFSLAPA